jgi:hypothetical protein
MLLANTSRRNWLAYIFDAATGVTNMRYIWSALVLTSMAVFSSTASGQEPGWTDRVLVSPEERPQHEATPIVHRPYRPLHFYGNTIRRLHYHGRVLPTPDELRRGVGL